MKAKELADYLLAFNPEAEVGILQVDLEKRVVHKNKGAMLISDMGTPVIILEVCGTAPLDKPWQMNLLDFPEVLGEGGRL